MDDRPLERMRVAIPCTNGVEQVELTDLLQRAGARSETVAR